MPRSTPAVSSGVDWGGTRGGGGHFRSEGAMHLSVMPNPTPCQVGDDLITARWLDELKANLKNAIEYKEAVGFKLVCIP